MNKKVLIPIIIVGLLLVAGIAYLAVSLNKQKEENRAMNWPRWTRRKWRTSTSSSPDNIAR